MASTVGRLRVIQPDGVDTQAAQEYSAQDCGICRNRPNCWDRTPTDEHIVSNLLACRIKRNINRDESTAAFLLAFRPVLKKYARMISRSTRVPLETALADMEAETIELLVGQYIFGERGYPAHWLFTKGSGWAWGRAHRYLRKVRRYEDKEQLLGSRGNDVEGDGEAYVHQLDGSLAPTPGAPEEETETDETTMARSVVDDGLTLSLAEYRVLKFCLGNATEARRPLNGLHVYLARSMGVVRARVTRLYADATKRLVSETRASL